MGVFQSKIIYLCQLNNNEYIFQTKIDAQQTSIFAINIKDIDKNLINNLNEDCSCKQSMKLLIDYFYETYTGQFFKYFEYNKKYGFNYKNTFYTFKIDFQDYIEKYIECIKRNTQQNVLSFDDVVKIIIHLDLKQDNIEKYFSTFYNESANSYSSLFFNILYNNYEFDEHYMQMCISYLFDNNFRIRNSKFKTCFLKYFKKHFQSQYVETINDIGALKNKKDLNTVLLHQCSLENQEQTQLAFKLLFSNDIYTFLKEHLNEDEFETICQQQFAHSKALKTKSKYQYLLIRLLIEHSTLSYESLFELIDTISFIKTDVNIIFDETFSIRFTKEIYDNLTDALLNLDYKMKNIYKVLFEQIIIHIASLEDFFIQFISNDCFYKYFKQYIQSCNRFTDIQFNQLIQTRSKDEIFHALKIIEDEGLYLIFFLEAPLYKNNQEFAKQFIPWIAPQVSIQLNLEIACLLFYNNELNSIPILDNCFISYCHRKLMNINKLHLKTGDPVPHFYCIPNFVFIDSDDNWSDYYFIMQRLIEDNLLIKLYDLYGFKYLLYNFNNIIQIKKLRKYIYEQMFYYDFSNKIIEVDEQYLTNASITFLGQILQNSILNTEQREYITHILQKHNFIPQQNFIETTATIDIDNNFNTDSIIVANKV